MEIDEMIRVVDEALADALEHPFGLQYENGPALAAFIVERIVVGAASQRSTEGGER